MWSSVAFLICAFALVRNTNGLCRGDVNITVGTELVVVTSDNYPSPYEDYTFCRYVIQGPEGMALNLQFQYVDIESSTSCAADKISIYDLSRPQIASAIAANRPCRPGMSNIRPSAGPFCGTQIPPAFTSRSNRVAIEFCSDYSLTGGGFNLTVEAASIPTSNFPPCDNTYELNELTDRHTITSPNFPNNYDNDRQCSWTFHVNLTSSIVRLDVRQVYLGSDCEDVLTITDKVNNQVKSYCGSRKAPDSMTFTLNTPGEIIVQFATDSADAYKGFEIDVSFEVCPPGQIACDDGKQCIRASYHCDGGLDCRDGSDEKVEYCYPECGKPHVPIQQDKIVGGSTVTRYSIPWQVALLNGGFQFCGGSIINERWILSAAHCLTTGQTAGYAARIGGHALDVSAQDEGALEIEFEKVICHPLYQERGSFDHDSCLIKLKQKVPFRKNIAPICLPIQGSDPANGTHCIVSGWGNQGQNKADHNDELRQVYVPVVDRETCGRAATYAGRILDTMVCAGTSQGGRDSCQGDSGGPFICPGSNGRWMLEGIVSWGTGCARPDIPGVYARVGSDVEWIIQTVANN